MAVNAPPASRRLPWPVEFYRSAVGKKWVMAVTGILLLAYLLAHLIGNLKMFLPPEAGVPEINLYAEELRELLFPILPRYVVLWIMRIGLIIAFLLHVHAAAVLTVTNRKARPTGYEGPRDYLVANYASRTMRYSGVLVLLWLLWHLADLTWGVQPFAPQGWEHGEVLANLIGTFSRPGVTALYVVANLALGDLRIERDHHSASSASLNQPTGTERLSWSIRPVCTAIGKLRLPTRMMPARPPAMPRRMPLNFGLLMPRLWNIDQAPWKMWTARATLAAM